MESSEKVDSTHLKIPLLGETSEIETTGADEETNVNLNALYDNGKSRGLKSQHSSTNSSRIGNCEKQDLGYRLLSNVKFSSMVVHILSVVFVVGVAIAMKTGTSLFSWHPFFMSLGVVFFIAQAIMVFSPSSSLVLSQPRQFKVKLHWVLHLCGIVSILVGLSIIVINKEIHSKPHATSWHGLLGFLSVTHLCLHCLGGLFLLYPQCMHNYFTLAQLKQMHATVGLLGYFLATAVVILGLFSNAFVSAVTNDLLWYGFASVPFVLALAIGNQVTSAYGPKKVATKSSKTKNQRT